MYVRTYMYHYTATTCMYVRACISKCYYSTTTCMYHHGNYLTSDIRKVVYVYFLPYVKI